MLDGDSLVGISTRYEINGPGTESQLERGLTTPSGSALGAAQPPVQRILGHSRG
jgi:hypothetical protein